MEVRTLQEGSEPSRTQTGRFQKTRGFATTSGQDYEVALCCLFLLRAIRLTSDFFLTSNLACAGKFDDVVLFYRPKGDQSLKYRAILLQAKHKDKTTEKKLTASNPFSLKVYLESFRKIRNLWEQSVNVHNQVIEFHEISLVLYTNTGCAIGDTALDVSDSSDVRDLCDILNTGGRLLRIKDLKGAGLAQEPESSDFNRHLILLTEQADVKKADKIIEEEIINMLGLTSLNIAKKLKSELKAMVKGWWREEGEGRYLTRHSKEWKKLLEMQVSRLNADTLIIDSQLNLGFTEVALKDFQCVIHHTQSWISIGNKYQAAVTRVRLLKALRSCLLLDTKFFEGQLGEVEALWGTFVCSTMALDISSDSPGVQSLLQHLQKAVRSHTGRHLVIIAQEKPSNAEWFVLKAEPTWSILDLVTRERLLSVQVDFQGNALALCDVIGLHTSYIMPEKIIKSLCDPDSGVVKLGLPMSTPLEYYIPRCIRRYTKIFNLDTFANTNTMIFATNLSTFKNKDIDRFKKLHTYELKITNEITETTFVEGVRINSEIQKLCCRFCVRGISGEVAEDGFKYGVTEFLPFTWICEEKFVVVEGVPGVGKSSFEVAMCSRVKEHFPDCWVLRVDMGKHSEFISKRDFSKASDIREFLLKGLQKDLHCLEQDLLEHSLYVTGNVFLFLDAYDEISPEFTAKCCILLKGIASTVKFRQMVVTTRPITSNELEKTLGIKVFKIPVFSEDEQSQFLERFFTSTGKNVAQEEISSLRQSAGPVLQIPLLCKMAAEILLYHEDKTLLVYMNPWRKVLLYQLFVEQSINNRLPEKFGLAVSMPGVKRLLESHAKEHLQNLQALAVRKLVPANQLSTLKISTKLPEEKLGLVVHDGVSVNFEHQTFAEYFLGRWLAGHWQKCHKELLCQVFSNDGNEFVVATLSWSLFEGFPLHLAVAQGDEVAVKQLLSSGITDSEGCSALHVAAMTQDKQRKVVELLVAAGEDPNKKDDIFGSNAVTYAERFTNLEFIDIMLENRKTLDDLKIFAENMAPKDIIQIIKQDLKFLFQYTLRLHKGKFKHKSYHEETLLHKAAANNSIGIMKVLIEMRHFLIYQDSMGGTPLHEASRYGNKEAVRLLLENRADPNIKANKGITALCYASGGGHLEVVKLLLEKGADPNIKTNDDDTALCYAAVQGHVEVVKLLLERGADPNMKTNNGYTALYYAAVQGHVELVKLLLEKGAISNIKTNDGYTALWRAASGGHLEVVKLLLEKGADTNIKTNKGNTALCDAASGGHLEVVKLLLEKEADPNVKTNDDDTALFYAAVKGHVEVGKLLLERGADPNIKTNNGYTALYYAAVQGHVELVKLLLEKGADPNIKTNDGYTALWRAAGEGHLKVVKLLLEKGAETNIKTNKGNTALCDAASGGHLEIVKLLLEKEADPNVKNNDDDTALYYAAVKGHVEVVKLLLERGADPNIKANNGYTALYYASVQGHVELVKLLLEKGAISNIKTNDGYTALWRAASGGHLEVVKVLLEKGADTNIKTNKDNTALCDAASGGHLEIVKLLLEKEADPNVKTNDDDTALYYAAVKGHVEVVKVLLERGADPNIKTNNGYTALYYASVQGHVELVKLLLEKGAISNIKTNDGYTALWRAASGGHLEVVKLLLEKGADTNIKTNKGNTALCDAASGGHLEVVKLLLEKEADPNVKTNDDDTALCYAAVQGHVEVVKLLLERGADPNMKTNNGYTALYYAAVQGHVELVKLLLEKGAISNIKTNDGYTALWRAASGGHLEVVKVLLEKGADTNIKTNKGNTALCDAASGGHLEVVKLLLEKEADPNVKNNDDDTALYYAAVKGHVEVVKVLLERGADPNIKTNNGYTALYYAAVQGHVKVVKLLLEKGADPNIKTNDGYTALCRAAGGGHMELVKLLLEEGADPNIKTNAGNTALRCAADRGHLEVVKLLTEKGADPKTTSNNGDYESIISGR